MPGGGGGKGKGKGDRKLAPRRQRTKTSPHLEILQDPQYLDNLSESEAKHLVEVILKDLEWNEKENTDLHGRKLFSILEALGLINCSPTPTCDCPPPECIEIFAESFQYQSYSCIANECQFSSENCDCDCIDETGCTGC
jgi:hypothetical protein